MKVGMNDKTCFSMTLLVHFLPILLIFHFVLPLIICTISLSPYLISFFLYCFHQMIAKAF